MHSVVPCGHDTKNNMFGLGGNHMPCGVRATAVQHQRFADISAQAVLHQWYQCYISKCVVLEWYGLTLPLLLSLRRYRVGC
jgi:hypothetical protein